MCFCLPQISSQSRVQVILATNLLPEILYSPCGCLSHSFPSSYHTTSPQLTAASPARGAAITSLRSQKDITLALEQPVVTSMSCSPGWPSRYQPGGGLAVRTPAGSRWPDVVSGLPAAGPCGEKSCPAQSCGRTEVLVSQLLIRCWPAPWCYEPQHRMCLHLPGGWLSSAQPGQGCHLCHQESISQAPQETLPWESGWCFRNRYQALETQLQPQNTMTWHAGASKGVSIAGPTHDLPTLQI